MNDNVNVNLKVKGLPFNRYSWLTTHNSFALAGARSATGSIVIAPMNQEDTIVDQLKVRFSFPFHIFLLFLLDYNIVVAVECEQSVGICSIYYKNIIE
jgi:hypothetical protein